MAFRNIPLDLVLPPGGLLTPGSSTIYLGGPRLPAELKARGDVGAIVFYSNPSGFAAGIKYWYISHGTVVEDITLGYCKTTGSLQDVWTSQYVSLGTSPDQTFAVDEFLVQAGSIISLINASGDVHMMTQSSGDVIMGGYPFGQPELHVYGWHSGSNVILKALFANQDIWNTSSNVQTIGGVGGFTVNQAWRITPDYLIDYRVYITGGAAFPAVNVAGYNLPGSFPTVDFITVGGHNLEAFIPACGEGGAGFYPMSIRIETTGTATIFLENNPQGNTALEAGGTFTLPKP